MTMQVALDERQAGIIAGANTFAQEELAPRAGPNDVAGAFPRDLIDRMASQGFLGATLPRAYGGLELDPIGYGLLIEAIEKGDSAASRLMTVHLSLVAQAILVCGNEEQRQRWLPGIATGKTLCSFALTEPDHGSDAASIETTYVPDGDGYLINGHKRWISFSGVASLLLVIARHGQAVSAFVVETDAPGVERIPMKGLMAGRACHICEIVLNNVRVAADHLLGREGQGFTYIVNTALDHGRYSIAWSGIGLTAASLAAMIRYAKKREQFGAKIFNHQFIKGMIADGVTNLYAARSLCLRAAQSRKEGSPDAITEAMIAKQFAAGVAFRVASDAVQVHGGNGFSSDYPAERLMREARVLEVIEGTTQVTKLMIALHGLRHFG